MNVPEKEAQLEKQLVEKGLTSARVTPEMISNVIEGEEFIVLGTTTICILHLKNGYSVSGESACVHPANFNTEMGQNISRERARAKIWPLEGYLLQQKLYEENTVVSDQDQNAQIKSTFEQLKDLIHSDEGYAWSWQCNLAVPMTDEGVSHEVANKSAARIMKHFFDIDITKFKEYLAFEPHWTELNCKDNYAMKRLSFNENTINSNSESLSFEEICDLCSIDWNDERTEVRYESASGNVGGIIDRHTNILTQNGMKFFASYSKDIV